MAPGKWNANFSDRGFGWRVDVFCHGFAYDGTQWYLYPDDTPGRFTDAQIEQYNASRDPEDCIPTYIPPGGYVRSNRTPIMDTRRNTKWFLIPNLQSHLYVLEWEGNRDAVSIIGYNFVINQSAKIDKGVQPSGRTRWWITFEAYQTNLDVWPEGQSCYFQVQINDTVSAANPVKKMKCFRLDDEPLVRAGRVWHPNIKDVFFQGQSPFCMRYLNMQRLPLNQPITGPQIGTTPNYMGTLHHNTAGVWTPTRPPPDNVWKHGEKCTFTLPQTFALDPRSVRNFIDCDVTKSYFIDDQNAQVTTYQPHNFAVNDLVENSTMALDFPAGGVIGTVTQVIDANTLRVRWEQPICHVGAGSAFIPSWLTNITEWQARWRPALAKPNMIHWGGRPPKPLKDERYTSLLVSNARSIDDGWTGPWWQEAGQLVYDEVMDVVVAHPWNTDPQGDLNIAERVAFCNEVGCNLYLNTWAGNSASHWRTIFEYVRDNLSPDLMLIAEWGNETWNHGGPYPSAVTAAMWASKVFASKGAKRGYDYNWNTSYEAYATREMSKVGRDVFVSQPHRFKVAAQIMVGWYGRYFWEGAGNELKGVYLASSWNDYTNDQTQWTWSHIDAISTGTYFPPVTGGAPLAGGLAARFDQWPARDGSLARFKTVWSNGFTMGSSGEQKSYYLMTNISPYAGVTVEIRATGLPTLTCVISSATYDWDTETATVNFASVTGGVLDNSYLAAGQVWLPDPPKKYYLWRWKTGGEQGRQECFAYFTQLGYATAGVPYAANKYVVQQNAIRTSRGAKNVEVWCYEGGLEGISCADQLQILEPFIYNGVTITRADVQSAWYDWIEYDTTSAPMWRAMCELYDSSGAKHYAKHNIDGSHANKGAESSYPYGNAPSPYRAIGVAENDGYLLYNEIETTGRFLWNGYPATLTYTPAQVQPYYAMTKWNCFTRDLGLGIHNFISHTFKVAFSLSTPQASWTRLSDVPQIGTTGGYVIGGYAVNVTWTETAGVGILKIDDKEITATSDGLSFRYAILYNDTAANDPLIGFYDFGPVTMQETDVLNINFDEAQGALRVQ